MNPMQILYAAKDAIVSLEVFYALVLMRRVNRQSTSVLSNSFIKSPMGVGEVAKHFDCESYRVYSHMEDKFVELDEAAGLAVTAPSDWLVTLAHSLCQGRLYIYVTVNVDNCI